MKKIAGQSFIILIVIFCFQINTFSADKEKITILHQDNQSIQFRYLPGSFSKRVVQMNNRDYVSYTYSDAAIRSQSGEPEIPVQTFVFAVPENVTIQATILSEESVEENNIDILPVQNWQEQDDADYQKGYRLQNQNEWFPDSVLFLEGPGYFGGLRIIQVHISPIVYNPGQRKVKRFQQIDIRLDFTPMQESQYSAQEKGVSIRDKAILDVIENPQGIQIKQEKRESRLFQKTTAQMNLSAMYKIPIVSEGIYRITGTFLKDHGIDIANIDPSTIKIYNNGGKILPRDLQTPRADSLIENAIQVIDGGDGQFNENDYILFYGRGVQGWNYENNTFSHYINPYTNENIYWLTFNDGKAGKRIQALQPPASAVNSITTFHARQFVEEEINNLYHSGIVWFGRKFDNEQRNYNFPLSFKNLTQSNSVQFKIRFYASAGSSHHFEFYLDDEKIKDVNFSGTGLRDIQFKQNITVSGSSHSLEIRYSPVSTISIVYLDWFEITMTSELSLVDGKVLFYSENGNQPVEYRIKNAEDKSYKIFDVTDFSQVDEIQDFSLESGSIVFKVVPAVDHPKKYFVLSQDQFRDIETITEDEPSNLHDPTNRADFIIITHPDFYSAASSLKNLRESHDGLKTEVVKISDIYDEFSGGLFDPTAIRDFLKYVYENWSQPIPGYVLLFGDGDYDYKNKIIDNDNNWIPPYETDELSEIANRTTDDWFTYVDGADSYMDFCIGRMPVQTTVEAENVVEKLVQYCSNSETGSWKNLFTIIADDEVTPRSKSETIHTYDAEDLVENYVPSRFDLRKIYLTEYAPVYEASASWISKPGVTEDFINQVNNGSLVINFIGHGSPNVWTDERVFMESRDYNRIQNDGRYGFWITATCDFGRWDNPEYQSFAEGLLTMENRGSIAMLASARLVYASSNAAFNKQFVKYLFQDPNNPMRIGQAMRLAKVATFNKTNNEKFHILGDPTLILESPKLEVQISEISPDSLKALSRISIKGNILDEENNPSNFNGNIYVKTFDSKKRVVYQTDVAHVEYVLPGNPIFRGSGTVTNGQFQTQFIVPKDISYGGKNGRISLYFENESEEGAGFRENLIVDGTATDLVDVQGPDIEFETKEERILDYGLLNTDDELNVLIEDDKSGINITGDVGHKIIGTPDDNSLQQKEITQYFEYDQNSYLQGSLKLPLSLFDEFASADNGMHQITIKAWDNANNSSVSTIHFELVEPGDLVLKKVLNYPNPFLESTTFTFYLNNDAQVELKIYTISGRLIVRLNDQIANFGFNQIPWDGRDQDGDPIANGVYLYQVKAKFQDQTAEYIGRLVKMK